MITSNFIQIMTHVQVHLVITTEHATGKDLHKITTVFVLDIQGSCVTQVALEYVIF